MVTTRSRSLRATNKENPEPNAGAGAGAGFASGHKRQLLLLTVVFVIALSALLFFFYRLPRPQRATQSQSSEEEYFELKMPQSIADVRELAAVLLEYKDQQYWAVLTGYTLFYLFLQAFAIPGSAFLSVLGGALYGALPGFLLVTCCATAGASFAYLVSNLLAEDIVKRFFPERLEAVRERINNHRKGIWWYMLALRVSPVIPNWFLNISAPLVSLPYYIFGTASFFGLMPAAFISAQIGGTLSQIAGDEPIFGYDRFLLLLGLALLSIVPGLLREKMDGNGSNDNKSKSKSV